MENPKEEAYMESSKKKQREDPRAYLDKYLTKYVEEGMMKVLQEKPENPLIALGTFLIEKGQELGN
jgi:hypothetical protein